MYYYNMSKALLLCAEELLDRELKKAFVVDVACPSNCPENVVMARGQTVFSHYHGCLCA